MDEQRIWAPWRIGYMAGDDDRPTEPAPQPNAWQPGADEGCFLCRAAAQYEQSDTANKQNLVVAVGQQTCVVLNRYPYTNGHLLVAPLRHVAALDELSPEEHLETMQTLAGFSELLTGLIRAQGFNVGLNLGGVAGAGLPGHLHWHLVPRWEGDNNFMPTVAGARCIGQSLEAVWDAITEAIV